MLKKLLLLISLGILAVTLSFGTLLYGMWATNTDTENISDINRANGYGSTSGFKTIEQTQQQTPAGTIATLITATVENELDSITPIFTNLGEDVSELAKDELVNLDITVKDFALPTIRVRYAPKTPADYVNGEYDNVVQLTSRMLELGYGYDINVTPTTTGRYITVIATTNGLTEDLQFKQQEVINNTINQLELKENDVYDITYNNVKTKADDSVIPFSVQAVIKNEFQKERVLTLDYSKLSTLSSSSGYPFTATLTKLYLSPESHQDQLIIVIPEMTDEELSNLAATYKTSDWLKRVVPRAPYEIVFRFDIDGVNKLTFPSFYI